MPTVKSRTKSASNMASNSIDAEFLAIADLSTDQLRTCWRNSFADEPPPVRSLATLAHLLAWRIQTDTIGGLDKETARALTKIADALTQDSSYEPNIRRAPSTGVVLSREWKGVVHRVTVTENGFQHLGKSYRSLSDIARTITGTRWSGPRFFGLERKQRTARMISQ